MGGRLAHSVADGALRLVVVLVVVCSLVSVLAQNWKSRLASLADALSRHVPRDAEHVYSSLASRTSCLPVRRDSGFDK